MNKKVAPSRATRQAAPETTINKQNQFTLPRSLPSLILLLTGLIVASTAGSMINDDVTPEIVNAYGLIAFPLASLLAACALFLEYRERQTVRRHLNVAATAFFLFVVCALLSLTQTHTLHAGLEAMALILGGFVFGGTAFRVIQHERPEFVVAIPVITVSIVVAIGLQEYLYNAVKLHNPSWRVFASFINPDFLAGFLLMVLPLTAVLFLVITDKHLSLLLGMLLAMQAVCLLVTQSRLGLAASVVSILVLFFLTMRYIGLTGTPRKRALVLTAIILVAVLVFSGPVVKRLRSSSSEAYSGQFRFYTWRGALKMALANPILGTGIGSFDTAYPRYAITGYTRHAHDSYLQLFGEVGFPGGLLLLAGSLLTLATGYKALRGSGKPIPGTDQTKNLLLAGFLASLCGALVHNLFDSDLYIPATSITFGLIIGSILGIAEQRKIEQQSPTNGIIRAIPVRAAVFLLVILLAGDSAQALFGRLTALPAYEAYQDRDLNGTTEGFVRAIKTDPLNSEYRLKYASVLESVGDSLGAETEYRDAVKVARTGKTLRRLGNFLATHGRPSEAIQMYIESRKLESYNLQNLLALASAYSATNQTAYAERVYEDMTRYFRQPVGRIRAMPELVEWEYGAAFSNLADMQFARGDTVDAEENYRSGAGILGEFWRTRNTDMALVRVSADIRKTTMDRYDQTLTSWIKTLTILNRMSDVKTVQDKQAAFQEERNRDSSKNSKE